MPLTGIDVSSYQGFIDWSAVSTAGLDFAYIKATEGTSVGDSQFARNWSVSRQRGVPRGAYHFFHFDADPVAQANFFLVSANPQAGDLLPAVDVETTDGVTDVTQLVQTLATFITEVEKTIGGRRMMIYTGWGFWNSYFQGSNAFSGHPLWIAEYNSQPQPSLPNGWSDWSIWQHASNGNIAGISGAVDLDTLNGDAAALPQITV